MRITSRRKNIAGYNTWYEFKKDLEKRLGHPLLNPHWLQVKPKAPLPWHRANIEESYSAVTRSKHS